MLAIIMFRVEGQLSLIEKSFLLLNTMEFLKLMFLKVFYLQQQRNNFSSEEP